MTLVLNLRGTVKTKSIFKVPNKIWAFALSLGVSTWTLLRVFNTNPAILGDEWVYLVSSRHYALWDPASSALGNYLFNFVYKATLICGDQFYSCTKALNAVFFAAFLFVCFLTFERLVPAWVGYALLLTVGLSPLSVYVSMYLPETLYFFLLSLALLALRRALEVGGWRPWLSLGLSLGFAALTKPHALLSLGAILIFVVIDGIFRRPPIRSWLNEAASFVAGFILARFVVGFIVGGPNSLALLNSYNSGEALGTLTSAQQSVAKPGATLVGSGQVNGLIGLFPSQFSIHSFSSAALVGVSIAVILANLLRFKKAGEVEMLDRLALAIFIWLGTMVIAIVAFTGWITGGGDDHTSRVLLRYYDFLFAFIVFISAAIVSRQDFEKVKLLSRWLPATLLLWLMSSSFTGFFSSLTIQIADAPFLAGLVVDRLTYDLVAILGIVGLGTLAFFPKYLKWLLPPLLCLTIPIMGYQAQGQYIGFRGQENSYDQIGKEAYQLLSSEERSNTLVVAQSRFDGRTLSFWMDADNELLIWPDGTSVDSSQISENTTYVLVPKSTPLTGIQVETTIGIGDYHLLKLAG